MARTWFDLTEEDIKNGRTEESILAKCREAWAMDCPDVEACLYADISTSSLSRYLKAHPEVAVNRDKLRQTPFLVARTTINKAIQQNPQYAFEYMKRKKRKEFGDNVDLTTKGEVINYTDDQIATIASRIKSTRGTPGEEKPD